MEGKTFGSEMSVAGFTLRGPIDRDHDTAIPKAMDFAAQIVSAIGMHCSHPPQITDYPAKDGKPSPGFLVTQPIIESAVLLDVWPPLQAMYVHVISCKEFQAEVLYPIFRDAGFEVRSVFGGYLGL